MIDIGDLTSRLKVDSLPERVSLDHDSVFYDNTSALPYPSTLHLWLIALGVSVRFIDKRPPTEHGFIERLQQTVTQQAGQCARAILSGVSPLWSGARFC